MDDIDSALAPLEAGPAPPPHAASHAEAGSDPVSVTALAGYPGGTATFLRADGAFAAPPAGATVGGSSTQVQFNDAGTLGGDAGLTYDKTTDALVVNGPLGVGTAAPGAKLDVKQSSNNDSGAIRVTRFDTTAHADFLMGGDDRLYLQCNGSGSGIISLGMNGDVLMSSDAAAVLRIPSGQIAFPTTQNPSASTNVLDDYREGTWTIVVGGTGGQSGQSYVAQHGHYVKTGKQVTVWGRVELAAKGTITGDAILGTLPVTPSSLTGNYAIGGVFAGALPTTHANVFVLAAPGTGYLGLFATPLSGGTPVALTTTNIGNSTWIIFTCTYQAA